MSITKHIIPEGREAALIVCQSLNISSLREGWLLSEYVNHWIYHSWGRGDCSQSMSITKHIIPEGGVVALRVCQSLNISSLREGWLLSEYVKNLIYHPWGKGGCSQSMSNTEYIIPEGGVVALRVCQSLNISSLREGRLLLGYVNHWIYHPLCFYMFVFLYVLYIDMFCILKCFVY